MSANSKWDLIQRLKG